jgi:hypothetical protein
MATKKDAKGELVKFIDKKAFDVIIKTSPDKFEEKDRKNFEDVKRKTGNEKEKFHHYKNAKDVKKNFLENTRSQPAHKLDKELKKLGLPTLPDLKDEFEQLCDKLEVK